MPGASYGHDAAGLRVVKNSTIQGMRHYAHGLRREVLGEYDATGAVYETVYLGATPVAVMKNAANHWIDADQIDTPRVVRNASNQIVWRWNSEAFGSTPAEENPSGLGAFEFNPRFPGQVFDRETGLHYNDQRDYAPSLGRYVQSDPIGLAGGINTYLYANASPLMYADPNGLNPYTWPYICRQLGLGRFCESTPQPLPLPCIDSLGVSAEAYAGVGGGIGVTWDRGTLEVVGRVGVGLGGGITIDPNATRSPHTSSSGSGYIARSAIGAQADVSAGPVGVGGGITLRSGNALTTPVGGDYVERSVPTLNFDRAVPRGFGIRGGVFLAPEVGSYTNWGDGSCGCRR